MTVDWEYVIVCDSDNGWLMYCDSCNTWHETENDYHEDGFIFADQWHCTGDIVRLALEDDCNESNQIEDFQRPEDAEPDWKMYKIPLLFITRIQNYVLGQFECDSDIDYNSLYRIYPTLERIFKIQDEDDHEIEVEGYKMTLLSNDYRREIEKLDVAFPVNSFSPFKPEKPFPPTIDLNYGGVYLYVDCKHVDGTEYTTAFWGD